MYEVVVCVDVNIQITTCDVDYFHSKIMRRFLKLKKNTYDLSTRLSPSENYNILQYTKYSMYQECTVSRVDYET